MNYDEVKTIEKAAKWIEENILSFVHIEPSYEDAPQEVVLSRYCIDAFKEDMFASEESEKIRFVKYLNNKTGCGLSVASKAINDLTEALKTEPIHKMDSSEEYGLRNQIDNTN